MPPIDPAHLAGQWVHSHEEDRPGQTVYRPASYPFPPSRGRGGFDLNPDGTLALFGPGPTDQTVEKPGRWTLTPGDKLTLYPHGSDQPERVLAIASLASDKLVTTR